MKRTKKKIKLTEMEKQQLATMSEFWGDFFDSVCFGHSCGDCPLTPDCIDYFGNERPTTIICNFIDRLIENG